MILEETLRCKIRAHPNKRDSILKSGSVCEEIMDEMRSRVIFFNSI